jgi:hypothetical protein
VLHKPTSPEQLLAELRAVLQPGNALPPAAGAVVPASVP